MRNVIIMYYRYVQKRGGGRGREEEVKQEKGSKIWREREGKEGKGEKSLLLFLATKP